MAIKFRVNADPKTPITKSPIAPPQPLLKITDFPNNWLKWHLHKAIATERGARHHNVVHASDLDPAREWCPREAALLTAYKKKRPKGFLSTSTAVTFRFGNKAADIVIDALPDKTVWGTWVCRVCSHKHLHQYRPKACYECGAKQSLLRYNEVFMRHQSTGVVGSVDLWVDLLGNGKLKLIEIKSEGGDDFKARTKPTFDHEWRTMLYLHIAAHTPWLAKFPLDLTEGRVLYICKSGYAEDPQMHEWKLADWKSSPFKEYVVKRNDDMIQNRMDLAASYRTWRDAWDSGTLLDLPDRCATCTAHNSTRANACPVREECWK